MAGVSEEIVLGETMRSVLKDAGEGRALVTHD